jgi:hypothetical protein
MNRSSVYQKLLPTSAKPKRRSSTAGRGPSALGVIVTGVSRWGGGVFVSRCAVVVVAGALEFAAALEFVAALVVAVPVVS